MNIASLKMVMNLSAVANWIVAAIMGFVIYTSKAWVEKIETVTTVNSGRITRLEDEARYKWESTEHWQNQIEKKIDELLARRK